MMMDRKLNIYTNYSIKDIPISTETIHVNITEHEDFEIINSFANKMASWGIAVNGSWTSWTWSDKDRRYALWEVAPEVRYYMGEKKAWYLGALFKAGQFNYKLSETGKQGDLMGGGITAGHQLRLNKALALDFNLGLGYLNADYEKYEVIDGVRVRHGNETKDWWGPINAGVTLVWKLF